MTRSHLTKTIELRVLDDKYVAEIAKIHARSFEMSLVTKLGPAVIERFYLSHLKGDHPIVNSVGAFVDDELFGYIVTGVFRRSTLGFIGSNRCLILWQAARRPWLIFDKTVTGAIKEGLKLLVRSFRQREEKTLEKVTNAESGRKPSYGLLAIAVKPESRSLGLGKILMDEFESLAVRNGFDRAHFTVDPRNTKAIRFYERLGWERVTVSGGWHGKMSKSVMTNPDDVIASEPVSPQPSVPEVTYRQSFVGPRTPYPKP